MSPTNTTTTTTTETRRRCRPLVILLFITCTIQLSSSQHQDEFMLDEVSSSSAAALTPNEHGDDIKTKTQLDDLGAVFRNGNDYSSSLEGSDSVSEYIEQVKTNESSFFYSLYQRFMGSGSDNKSNIPDDKNVDFFLASKNSKSNSGYKSGSSGSTSGTSGTTGTTGSNKAGTGSGKASNTKNNNNNGDTRTNEQKQKDYNDKSKTLTDKLKDKLKYVPLLLLIPLSYQLAKNTGVCKVNGICSGKENCRSCIADCKFTNISCGDGVCTEGENCINCPADCNGNLPDTNVTNVTTTTDVTTTTENGHNATNTTNATTVVDTTMSEFYCCGLVYDENPSACGDLRCSLNNKMCVETACEGYIASSAMGGLGRGGFYNYHSLETSMGGLSFFLPGVVLILSFVM